MNQERIFRPSDEFRARLEQQVLRRHRQQPVGPMASGEANRPLARVASIVAISFVLGATGGFASAQIGRNAQRDSLLAAARAEAALADAQRELARAESREIERGLRLGVVGWDTSYQANAVLADAERRSNRLALDIEEIAASGASPRDDLNAPVVNGRDFVKLRIEVDVAGVQARLRAATAMQSWVDVRVQAGATSSVTGAAAALNVATIQAELAMLAEKLALRAEFLKSGTSIDELTRRLHAAQLRQDMSALQQRLVVARDRLATVEQQQSLGLAGEVELLRARIEVKEIELSLQRLSERERVRP